MNDAETGDTVQLTSRYSGEVVVGTIASISASMSLVEYLIESPELEPMWYTVYADGNCIRRVKNLSRRSE